MGELVRHPHFLSRPVHDPWITKPALAWRLGVSTRTIDRWVITGLPRCPENPDGAWRYVGQRRHFKEAAVLQWLDSQRSER